jgi:microcystin-dependent protein
VSEPFIAEIRIFAGTFAPRGWAYCDGQLLQISQNTALFSLVGTTYGGDGRVTFGLPDLRGRAPMHVGTGPGLTNRRLGERGGIEMVTLNAAQLPAHTHTVNVSTSENTSPIPDDHAWGVSELGDAYRSSPDVSMSPQALTNAGGGQPHRNMQPYIVLSFIIALVGIYPSRN